jgi:RNA polymerase sigma-70 factor, ECF subfamily
MSLVELHPITEASEEELVSRAQARDEAAFAELMRRNNSASFRLALSVLRDRQEAEDQVQTSFLKAWLHLPGFQSDSRFSTWLRTIVRNQSLMALRKTRNVRFTSLDEPDADGRTMELASTSVGPERSLSQSQLSERLNSEVRKLPAKLREVLILRDMEELSTEAAAARMGLSEPAIKSRLNRARAMLRQRMERHTKIERED